MNENASKRGREKEQETSEQERNTISVAQFSTIFHTISFSVWLFSFAFRARKTRLVRQTAAVSAAVVFFSVFRAVIFVEMD